MTLQIARRDRLIFRMDVIEGRGRGPNEPWFDRAMIMTGCYIYYFGRLAITVGGAAF